MTTYTTINVSANPTIAAMVEKIRQRFAPEFARVAKLTHDRAPLPAPPKPDAGDLVDGEIVPAK